MKKVKLGLKDLPQKWHQSTLNDIERLQLPSPDHEYGYSSKWLKKNMTESEWSKFNEWTYGQTCLVDEKLGLINYTHDVIRGLDLIRNNVSTYFD